MDEIAVEYCALTLAVVLVWHPLQAPNRSGQWSPYAISEAMKCLPYGTELNFTINPLALHQGFHLFKKTIRNFGHGLVSMRARNIGLIISFMTLPEVLHGWDIIFQPMGREFHGIHDLSLKISEIAVLLMKLNFNKELRFKSLVDIGAFLWQQQLPVRQITPVKEVQLSKTSNKRRKTSSELSERQLSNCAKKILTMVSTSICVSNEDSIPYLVAAIQESRSLASVSKELFQNEDEKLEILTDRLLKDERIVASIRVLPKKNITFSDEEKAEVLRIHDVISAVLDDQSPEIMNGILITAATLVKVALEHHTGYSELVEGSVDRWSKNRDVYKEKGGRKVDKNFECAVWGQLVICELETVMVRSYL